MATSVVDWINEAEPWQQKTLLELRGVIRTEAPDADETLKWGQPCYSRNGLFCYLQRAKQHVTLGFQQGARLDDPEGMLQGDGKLMRHLKFARDDSIDTAMCSAFVRAAIRLD